MRIGLPGWRPSERWRPRSARRSARTPPTRARRPRADRSGRASATSRHWTARALLSWGPWLRHPILIRPGREHPPRPSRERYEPRHRAKHGLSVKAPSRVKHLSGRTTRIRTVSGSLRAWIKAADAPAGARIPKTRPPPWPAVPAIWSSRTESVGTRLKPPAEASAVLAEGPSRPGQQPHQRRPQDRPAQPPSP